MMSTPKRRKPNDYQSSPQTVRSLDYFFGKQSKQQEVKSSDKLDLDDSVDTVTVKVNNEEKQSTQDLTDEELARKLQGQWDQQDRLQRRQEQDNTGFSSGLTVEAKVVALDAEESSRATVEDTLLTCRENVPIAKVEEFSLQGSGKGTKATLSLQSATAQEDIVSSTVPFDESPLTFLPSRYLPELKKHWAAEGGNASYALLTRCFMLINSTQSRIRIVDTLVNFLRTIIEGDPESLLSTVGT